MTQTASTLNTRALTRVVVLISGSGSNLQALIDGQKKGDLPIEIVGIISNRPQVLGLTRAQEANLPALVLDHKNFTTREDFDRALIELIDGLSPDLVVLAGFMRVLTAEFTQHYLGKMLNIHPSLLPKFPGLHTHQRALEAGEKTHGVTVHFVTAELDGGPSIIQASIPVVTGDDESSLAKRVQRQEHLIYPLAIKWFAQGELQMKHGKSFLRGELLPSTGFQIHSEEH